MYGANSRNVSIILRQKKPKNYAARIRSDNSMIEAFIHYTNGTVIKPFKF